MSHYTATVEWQREPGAAFTDNRYSRAHVLRFDGGVTVAGSSSPTVVPLPLSRADAVDPEEAFVASLASCHMLWFLSLAARKGFVVETYEDNPEGRMDRNDHGVTAMTSVELRPKIRFSGKKIPTPTEIDELHHRAHESCYLANSVRTQIQIASTHSGKGDSDV